METEECDHDHDRCKKCTYNDTTYNENDIVKSDQCYHYICSDNYLRMELLCFNGPSSQEDCAEGETYIAPADDTEALAQNCCGRCEQKKCYTEEYPVTLNVEGCIPAVVDIGQCKGSCGMPTLTIASLPTTLDQFNGTVSLHNTCECCTGDVVSRDIELNCEGILRVVQMGVLANCRCQQCSEYEYWEPVQGGAE
jgi:hypothetical protein